MSTKYGNTQLSDGGHTHAILYQWGSSAATHYVGGGQSNGVYAADYMIASTNTKTPKEQILLCPYCDLKNDNDQARCVYCGGGLYDKLGAG